MKTNKTEKIGFWAGLGCCLRHSREIKKLWKEVKKIMATNEEIQAEVEALAAKAEKIQGEVQGLHQNVADLEAQVAALNEAPAGLVDAVNALKVRLQTIDDLTEDEVVEEPPPA